VGSNPAGWDILFERGFLTQLAIDENKEGEKKDYW
jgi:hypothetical protein